MTQNPNPLAADWKQLEPTEVEQLFELLGIKDGTATFRMKGTGVWIRTAVYKDGAVLVTRFAPDLLKVG